MLFIFIDKRQKSNPGSCLLANSVGLPKIRFIRLLLSARRENLVYLPHERDAFMTTQELLRLYDHHERIMAAYPCCRREFCEPVVRVYSKNGDLDFLLHSRLTEDNADAIIEREVGHFRNAGRHFEWKLYAHDSPPDLKERLAARGFRIGEDEAIMALELADLPSELAAPQTHDIRKVDSEARLADFAAVNRSAWPDDNGSWMEVIVKTIREQPERLSAYVAYADGKPVSAARVDFPESSPFASLWGGATLEGYRKRGIYTALVAIRAQEAIRRGYRFLTIDASPMSRPIAEKHGFRLLTVSNPCDSPR